jgi:F0F1-type ATP synthase assembly protein I
MGLILDHRASTSEWLILELVMSGFVLAVVMTLNIGT